MLLFFTRVNFSCVVSSEGSFFLPISWKFALPHMLHSGEFLIKEHIVLEIKITSSDTQEQCH